MGAFEKFPYTNFHDLNLDWFLAEFKKLQDEWNSFGYTVTATAVVGTVPSVEVTGDLLSGLNFKFTLVKGETGDTGPQGETGNGINAVTINNNYQITFTFTDGTSFTTPSLKGPQGEGLEVLDVYATLTDLQTAHPLGNSGDMYLVGTSPSFMLYVWSTSQAAWVQAGALSSPSPSVTTPLMDGMADNGTEFAYARGDHRHPTDTSRAAQTDLEALQLSKQDALVSGTNIKTINSNSILGSGDITTLQLRDVYPVGSIYISTSNINPATIFGFGTWVAITNKFLIGAGDTYTLHETGGESEHILTVDEIPAHHHTYGPYLYSEGQYHAASGSSGVLPHAYQPTGTTQDTGGGLAHNNMPPYLAVNIWERTA